MLFTGLTYVLNEVALGNASVFSDGMGCIQGSMAVDTSVFSLEVKTGMSTETRHLPAYRLVRSLERIRSPGHHQGSFLSTI